MYQIYINVGIYCKIIIHYTTMYLYDINIKLTCHWRGCGSEPGLRTFKHFGLESQNKN